MRGAPPRADGRACRRSPPSSSAPASIGGGTPGDAHELAGRARRDEALAGDARPGDVLALAGGALVRDANANGRVDGGDGRVDELVSTHVRTRGILLDVRG